MTRGTGKDLQLCLLQCPQPNCKNSPLMQKFAYIKNKLTIQIRSIIQKYYAGWIVCEDPGCTGRSRRVPLSFQRAFPICQTCHKATMYREFTDSQLYTQLLFFARMCDFGKFVDTYPDYQMKMRQVNENWGNVQAKYNDLYALVKKEMMSNKYCMVSLNKVFEGFFPVSTGDRSKTKNWIF